MLRIINHIAECIGHLLVTHKGRFHADDIFATVILYLAYDGNVSLLRTDTPPRYIRVPHTVYDVGYEQGYYRYDHHQRGGNGVRKVNGIPYAASGLVWRDFGSLVLKKQGIPDEYINPIWKAIDTRLIQPIDAWDNGHSTTPGSGFSLTKVVSNFNTTWLEDTTPEEAFNEAFEFALKVFTRELQKAKARVLASPHVEKAIEESENGIMVLEPFVPWEGAVARSENPKAKELLYVIAPSNRTGYSVIGVKKSLDSFEVRKPFPEAWAGQPAKALQVMTGVESIHFCHAARFIAGTVTLEDAKKLAALAVSYEEKILYLKEG